MIEAISNKTGTQVIPPQSGAAFILKSGQKLKIIDPRGSQVSDLLLFNADDKAEKLSSGKTLDFEETIRITKGHSLWSNRSRIMASILEDTNGINDFLLAPCSAETFKIMYHYEGYHPSCLQNLADNLASFGITVDELPNAFNVFMKVLVDENGKISVLPPKSKAGDFLLLEAKMDLIVGMTACSAEDSNGGSFKPIHYEIMES